MNDPELNELLRAASLPERDADYWEEFPKTITRRLSPTRTAKIPETASTRFLMTAWKAAWAATAGAVAAVIILVWNVSNPDHADRDLVVMQKYFQEIAPLFPHQLRAIHLDEHGPRLVLAETAEVPISPPVYLRICRPQGCLHSITFSGQQVQLNGELYEVLTDGDGHVLIAGPRSVWTSAEPSTPKSAHRVQARILEPL